MESQGSQSVHPPLSIPTLPRAPQVALRPFTEEGFQSAGNPGITFLAPEEWCASTTAVAGVPVTGPNIPGRCEVVWNRPGIQGWSGPGIRLVTLPPSSFQQLGELLPLLWQQPQQAPS